MERIIKNISGFLKEKRELYEVGKMIDGSYSVGIIGLKKDENGLKEDVLGIVGFKAEPRFMFRNTVKDGLGRYDSVEVTTFDNQGVIIGSMEILSRRIRG